jgi:hypothetical protein
MADLVREWKRKVHDPEVAGLRKRIAVLEAAVLAAKVLLEPTSEATEDAWQVLDVAYHGGNASSE